MDPDLFNDAITNFVNWEVDKLNKIRNYPTPDFNQLHFKLSEIESQKEYLLSLLEANKISQNSSVLYYIILDTEMNIDEMTSKLKKYKKAHPKNRKSYIALPKINFNTFQNESNCLYVGKTNSNFISRFEYHLGVDKGKSTFALHLNAWKEILKPKTELSFTMFYSIIPLKKEQLYFLEMIESGLHHYFKPLLGRASH